MKTKMIIVAMVAGLGLGLAGCEMDPRASSRELSPGRTGTSEPLTNAVGPTSTGGRADEAYGSSTMSGPGNVGGTIGSGSGSISGTSSMTGSTGIAIGTPSTGR